MMVVDDSDRPMGRQNRTLYHREIEDFLDFPVAERPPLPLSEAYQRATTYATSKKEKVT